MKAILIIMGICCIFFFFKSCRTGYVKNNGDWFWATYDESHGKRYHWIEGIDQKSFKVLSNINFAIDKEHAYFQGKLIDKANPSHFQPLTDNTYGYAKDGDHVFFDNAIIINADPLSFEVLDFPYSRDKNDVYCGTLPMGLTKDEILSFEVINEDKWLKGTKSSMSFDHFLTYNPNYKVLKNTDEMINKVIIGEYGSGKTLRKKYKGLYEIKQ